MPISRVIASTALAVGLAALPLRGNAFLPTLQTAASAGGADHGGHDLKADRADLKADRASPQAGKADIRADRQDLSRDRVDLLAGRAGH